MTIMLLLAGLNSCTNPWIYLAFSDHLYRQLARCFGRGRGLERGMTESSMRSRSMIRSTTEVTRMDSIISKFWTSYSLSKSISWSKKLRLSAVQV